MNKEPLFVEQRAEKSYAIRGSERASAVCETQQEAILRAKMMTKGPVLAERVRRTKLGTPNKWRHT